MSGSTNGSVEPKAGASIRAAIFASPETTLKSEVITFFGQKIELRQASLEQIMEAQELQKMMPEKKAASVAYTLVMNSFVPGTEDRVFEMEDVEQILALPFGKDLIVASETMNRLTGVDFLAEKGESETIGNTP